MTDLGSFLDLYYRNLDVLRERVDFTDLTRAYLKRAAAGGVRHAEIFFDPQAHTSRGIPLTVCPLSNVRLQVVDTLADHPLLVTVNSDDPAYFGGYVDDNYAALTAEFGLDAAQLALLARNGIEASFLSAAKKAALDAEVDVWQQAQV